MENREPGYYAIIPANVRYDPHLTKLARLLYGEITALSNKYGFCFANNQYFAKLYGKIKDGKVVPASIRTISRTISSLKKRGYIDVVFDEGGQRKLIPRDCKSNYDDVVDATTKTSTPLDKNDHDPLDKKVYHNNKAFNTTDIDFALDVIDLYKQRLPECRQLRKPKESHRGKATIRATLARASENDWGHEISPWIELFDKCRASDLLMRNKNKWFDLPWLLQPIKFEMTLDGNYDDDKQTATSVEQDKLSDAEKVHYGQLGN